MLHLFEEQERQTRLKENAKRREHDLALTERIQSQDKKNNLRKIPFHNEADRDDLRNTLHKKYSKDCEDNIKFFEEALGREIGATKLKSESDEKIRQLLWETTPELRELRKQMLLADVARDQAMQLAEKQALAELKRQEEESLAAAAEEEKRKYEEEEKRREELEFQAKLKYHRDLDDLRQFKVAKDDTNVEQLRKEKDAIDEIKRKIEEEDREIARKKDETRKELHRQALELKEVRQNLKLLEKQKEKAREMKADEYRKAQELRAKQLEEEKQLNYEQKLQLQEELLSYLEKMYAEKAKQELLWTELSIEEKEASEKEKSIAAEKRQKKIREELQHLYDMQVYVKKQKEELQRKEEELFRQNLIAKLYEEEKLEYMSQQKRRLKQLEHRRLAQELIEENRRKKATEQAREIADHKYLKEQEAKRLKMVEEERRKFLNEHAKELLGYLPKRLFKDKEEIERLGEDFRKFYSRKNCSTIFQAD